MKKPQIAPHTISGIDFEQEGATLQQIGNHDTISILSRTGAILPYRSTEPQTLFGSVRVKGFQSSFMSASQLGLEIDKLWGIIRGRLN